MLNRRSSDPVFRLAKFSREQGRTFGAPHVEADSFSHGDAEAYLPSPVRCSDETFVLRVRGESRELRSRDGDLIFVAQAISPYHGPSVVVQGGGFQ